MKIKYLILTCMIFVFWGCEKSVTEVNSVVNTKWKMIKAIDNNTGLAFDFPSEIDDFEIVFEKDSTILLPNYCNYSFGEYRLLKKDSINIFNIGQGTKKFCFPQLAMDWEFLFITNLYTAVTYSIAEDELTLNCRENKLVFKIDNTTY